MDERRRNTEHHLCVLFLIVAWDDEGAHSHILFHCVDFCQGRKNGLHAALVANGPLVQAVQAVDLHSFYNRPCAQAFGNQYGHLVR